MSDRIFYSWQSDLPNKTNRGFIQSALEKAVSELTADDSVAVEPVVDRDTLDEPGAPDIAATILKKIDSASVFVCDVSMAIRPENGRACPNPNVLFELGYAIKTLTSERVILVFNKAYGDVAELPFDLRYKRVLSYDMSMEQMPAEPRKMLSKALASALISIFDSIEVESKATEKSNYLTSLNTTLTTIILFGEESRLREVDPWAQEVVNKFESSASDISDLIANEITEEYRIVDDLEELFELLNQVVDFQKAMGKESHDNFNSIIDKAVQNAWRLKKEYIDTTPLNEESKSEVPKLIKKHIRIIKQGIDRYERSDGDMKYSLFEKLLEEIPQSSEVLLKIGYYRLDDISPNLSETLRNEVRPMHLIDYQYEMQGSHYEEGIIDTIKEKLSNIETVIGSLF